MSAPRLPSNVSLPAPPSRTSRLASTRSIPAFPAIALADKALENGSVDKLVGVLNDATAKGIRERFRRALETKKHADESVTAGREFVEAYVIFTHYVEELHASVKGGTEHHEHQ